MRRITLAAALMVIAAPVMAGGTYRLVHAIGNAERILQTGMSQSECRRQRDETRRVATLLGTVGSVTCLPDSLFD